MAWSAPIDNAATAMAAIRNGVFAALRVSRPALPVFGGIDDEMAGGASPVAVGVGCVLGGSARSYEA